jgi:putative ABC transport system ATP-binding protein
MSFQEIVLRATDVTRSFGQGEVRTTAVAGVSLELHRRQVSLLMGPSGSGKSTLLAILSGLLQPDGGRVDVLGESMWRMSESQREAFRRRHFGFIFQGYNLFPALTALQQLEIVLRWGDNLTHHEARRRSTDMLALLGLSKKMHLRPAQLSGGEKQRVAIGRALVKEPALCFADEPTSALDWSHGEQVVELLVSAAHEQGSTILMVSHDPRIIPYADQVFHIEDGSLLETNSPADAPAPQPMRSAL